MKRSIPKLWILLLALFVSVGSSVAYLTATDADVNVMTLGDVKISLHEQERTPAGALVDFNDGHPLYPAVFTGELTADEDGYWTNVMNAVDKIVSVQNTGKSAAYIRLWFAFECVDDRFFADKIQLNLNEADWRWDFLKADNGDLFLLTLDNACYTVATATYAQALPAGEFTPVSLRQVLLDPTVTNEEVDALGEEYTILVVAQGIQTQNFEDADQALAAGFGDPRTNLPFIGNTGSETDVMYFPTLIDAVRGINGSRESNGAAVSAYTQESKKHVSLLQDIETGMLQLSNDLILHLNGYTLHCEEPIGIDIAAGSVVIDGTVSGSAVTAAGTIAAVSGGNLDISGGTYTASTSGAGSPTSPAGVFTVANDAAVHLTNASILASDRGKGTITGILGAEGSVITAENCTIEAASSWSLETAGIHTKGALKLTGCTVLGKSDYTANAAGTAYACNSRGIYSEGYLELNDCYVWGAHAGVTSKGELLVNGGTYEGYGHGGLYCSNAGKTVAIYNAKINWADMAEGYIADAVAGTNGAGMYIGGASNITLYMDNCELYGTLYGVVLRGSGGEKNNRLYISNSTMDFSKYSARISSSTSRVYIGMGNDFGASTANYASRCVTTNDSYAPQ